MFNESLINSVTISKQDLLTTLETNMGNHKTAVAELLLARRDQIEEQLTEVLADITQDVDHQPEAHFHFPEIVDHTKDYERAIKMIKMSVEDEITLEESQFQRLVMDEWEWKNEMVFAQTAYADKMPGARRR